MSPTTEAPGCLLAFFEIFVVPKKRSSATGCGTQASEASSIFTARNAKTAKIPGVHERALGGSESFFKITERQGFVRSHAQAFRWNLGFRDENAGFSRWARAGHLRAHGSLVERSVRACPGPLMGFGGCREIAATDSHPGRNAFRTWPGLVLLRGLVRGPGRRAAGSRRTRPWAEGPSLP